MKVIWVNGCFDVLHRGHIELFRHAKLQGDFLVVGIDADQRIKSSKGINRPFNNLQDRKYVLESIKYIDRVVSFGSDKELTDWIKSIRPSVMIVGSDWQGKNVVGQEYADKVQFFARIGSHSTTKILEGM